MYWEIHFKNNVFYFLLFYQACNNFIHNRKKLLTYIHKRHLFSYSDIKNTEIFTYVQNIKTYKLNK